MVIGGELDITEDKIEPVLDAFLLCESVNVGPDGAITLKNLLPRNELALKAPSPVTLTLFTRWATGIGSFVQWVRLTRPDGRREDVSEARFQLRDQVEAFNGQARVTLDIKDGGVYRFDLILDGFPVVEKLLMVTMPDSVPV